MHLRIPFPQTTDIKRQNRNQQECICTFPSPQQQTLKDRTELNRNASAHSLPPKQQTLKENSNEQECICAFPSPQTTNIKRQNRNQQECICAFPFPKQQTLKYR